MGTLKSSLGALKCGTHNIWENRHPWYNRRIDTSAAEVKTLRNSIVFFNVFFWRERAGWKLWRFHISKECGRERDICLPHSPPHCKNQPAHHSPPPPSGHSQNMPLPRPSPHYSAPYSSTLPLPRLSQHSNSDGRPLQNQSSSWCSLGILFSLSLQENITLAPFLPSPPPSTPWPPPRFLLVLLHLLGNIYILSLEVSLLHCVATLKRSVFFPAVLELSLYLYCWILNTNIYFRALKARLMSIIPNLIRFLLSRVAA